MTVEDFQPLKEAKMDSKSEKYQDDLMKEQVHSDQKSENANELLEKGDIVFMCKCEN